MHISEVILDSQHFNWPKSWQYVHSCEKNLLTTTLLELA